MKNELVIMYDYDGTLASGNIQEPHLIPLLMPDDPNRLETFWKESNEMAHHDDLDTNITYMQLMIDKAKKMNIPLTREFLSYSGSFSKVFPGLDTWFDRINAYGKERNVVIKHYVISAGNLEMIQGSPIAKNFEKIYACKFNFDPITKEAIGIGLSVDDHKKVQYIDEIRTPIEYRKHLNPPEEVKIPFTSTVYIGDGTTDVKAMLELNSKGGYSFVVFDPSKGNEKAGLYIKENIAKNAYPTDSCYKKNSKLERHIFDIIDRVSARLQQGNDVQLSIFDFDI